MRALLGLAALFSVACESPDQPFAELLKVTDRAQLIGGPGAQGAVGDYLLHNDKIRIIIHGRVGDTGSSTTFGATILDADLQRPQTEFGGAMGRDSLFELGPLVSLGVIKPTDSSAFSIVRSSQSDAGGALLRIEGPMGHIVDTLKLFAVVPELDVPKLWFRIDYELRAGENFVRMTVDAFLDGQPDEAAEVVEQSPVVGSEPFMSILKGSITNDPTNPACATHEDCGASERCMTVMGNSVCRSETAEIGGAFGGWLALMGKKVSNFAPGNGFDPWLSLKAAAANGSDFFANPSPIAFMGGAGDRVSYALYTEGDLLVPVSTSAFTMAFSHEVHCTLDDPDCLIGKALRMRGYFAVGEGDIASATEGLIALRELPNAELSGVVLNQRDGLPVSKADVVVFSDPWAAATDDEVSNRSYAELIAAQRSASTDAINTAGSAGVITHMRSDVGSDPILDGVFSGKVALLSGSPQRVFLVARKGEQISAPVMVKLAPGESAVAVVILAEQGHLDVEVRDASGLAVPAKITIGRCMPECASDADCGDAKTCLDLERRCVPVGGCAADNDCDPDERCDVASAACVCDGYNSLPREMGGHWQVDGVTKRSYIPTQGKTMSLPPGTYELIASRGIEYSIDRQYITLLGSRHTRVIAHVARVVDSSGFISADFHVHGSNSPDSAINVNDRVLSFAGEGVELLTATDHDVFTDYSPTLEALGLQPFLTTQSGVESSPLMLGHFLGFPVDVDVNRPQGMPKENAWDWYQRDPETIMKKIRKSGALDGEKDAVVLLAHVYDYFNYYALNSYNLNPDGNVLYAGADPVLNALNFSADFDGFEIANGKSQDYIRKPTVSELRDYNVSLALLGERLRSRELSVEQFSRRHQRLGRSTLGQLLSRTPAEQDAFMDASRGLDCSCLPAQDCLEGRPDDAPCAEPRGVVEDWFRMGNAGIFPTGVANSDSHGLWHIEAGMPRNFVRSETDMPVRINTHTVDKAVRAGQVVASYGPFIRFTINDEGVGSELEASGSVRLAIEVQSPTWFDVDRVEIYRNGRLLRIVQACTQIDQNDCITVPNTKVQNLNLVFDDEPQVDSWYAVAAMGINGRDLAPVYTSEPLARLGFNETVNSLGSILPIDIGGGNMVEPSVYPILPYAMTNPIRVIIDGDGQFTPPAGIRPSWSP